MPEEEAPGPATDLLPFAPPEAWNISAGARPNSGNFTVTEATWVNLDVSPDGADIVFDALGGIYRMSIAGGGRKRTAPCSAAAVIVNVHASLRDLVLRVHWVRTEAEVLYRGIAFNTQPRYAPDGQSLLFRTYDSLCPRFLQPSRWLTAGAAPLPRLLLYCTEMRAAVTTSGASTWPQGPPPR